MDSYNTSEMDKLRELFDEGLGALILVKKINFFGQDCIFCCSIIKILGVLGEVIELVLKRS